MGKEEKEKIKELEDRMRELEQQIQEKEIQSQFLSKMADLEKERLNIDVRQFEEKAKEELAKANKKK